MKLDTQTRQDQIIQTSLEIIKNNGIQGLTIRKISRQIGISEPAIYRHFENKLAILCGILDNFNQHLSLSIDQNEDINALEKIESLINAHLQYIAQNPVVAAVIFSEEIFQNESILAKEVHHMLNERIDKIKLLIQKGQQCGEIKSQFPSENIAYMFLGSLRLLVTKWRLESYSFDLENKGKILVENLISLINS